MANRFFVAGGVDNNWGTTGNWSLTSGGAGGEAVPLATDDVFLDASSPNCTVNAASRVALSLIFTGYTNTITMTNRITISGNVTLGANMIVSGTNYLAVDATGNFTSNGKAWPNTVTVNGNSKTVTFTDASNIGHLSLVAPNGNSAIALQADMIIIGNLNWGITVTPEGINGLFNVYVGGNVTGAGTTSYLNGTSTIIMNGTGTWSGSNTGGIRNNLIFNTAGTITISGNVYYNTGTLTNTAGTVITTGSTLNVGSGAGGALLDLNNLTLNNFKVNNTSGNISLVSGFVIGGLFSNVDSATHTVISRGNSEYPPAQSDTYVKTTTAYSTGYAGYQATNPIKSLTEGYSTGAWLTSTGSAANQRFHIDLGSAKQINRVYYENLHNHGGLTQLGVRHFTLWGSNTAGDFADLVYANDGTWEQLTTDVAEFDRHVDLNQVDPKYVVVTNSTAYRYYAFKFADKWAAADNMGVRRIELRLVNTPLTIPVTLLAGATQDLRFLDARDIDSSGGISIYTRGGVLSNTTNWKVLSAPKTVSSAF